MAQPVHSLAEHQAGGEAIVGSKGVDGDGSADVEGFKRIFDQVLVGGVKRNHKEGEPEHLGWGRFAQHRPEGYHCGTGRECTCSNT